MRFSARRFVPAAAAAVLTAIPVLTMVHMVTAGHQAVTGSTGATPTPSPPATAVPTVVPHAIPTPTRRATPTRKPTVASGASKHPSHRRRHYPAVTAKTYWGPVVADPYGNVQAEVRVRGKKITAAWISAPMTDAHSIQVNEAAVPILKSETLRAQSANISLVSGATQTSAAYIQSLQSALTQAGL